MLKQKFENIHVVGTTEAIVGAPYHHAHALNGARGHERRGKNRIGAEQIGNHRFHLIAERAQLLQCRFGFMHFGR